MSKQQLVSPERGLLGRPRRVSLPSVLPPDSDALEGEWTVCAQDTLASAGARLDLSCYADQVYLVLTLEGIAAREGVAARVGVLLDGTSIGGAQAGRDVQEGKLVFEKPRLYSLVDSHGRPGQHTLSLRFVDGDASANSFTFG